MPRQAQQPRAPPLPRQAQQGAACSGPRKRPVASETSMGRRALCAARTTRAASMARVAGLDRESQRQRNRFLHIGLLTLRSECRIPRVERRRASAMSASSSADVRGTGGAGAFALPGVACAAAGSPRRRWLSDCAHSVDTVPPGGGSISGCNCTAAASRGAPALDESALRHLKNRCERSRSVGLGVPSGRHGHVRGLDGGFGQTAGYAIRAARAADPIGSDQGDVGVRTGQLSCCP